LLLAALQAGPCLCLRAGHESSVSPNKARLGGKHLLHEGVTNAVKELQNLEASTAERQKDVRQTILYVDKLKDSIGKEDSIFNGKMDQADTKMALRMLALFSDEKFVNAVDQAFKSLDLVAKHVPALSARRVKEVLGKPRATADERFVAASTFFRKETSLLGAQTGKAVAALKVLIQALPQDLDGYGRLGSAMLEEFAEQANNVTAHFTGSEDIFCSHLMSEIEERTVPIIQHANGLLPRIELYAKAQAPEVMPNLSRSLKKLSAFSDTLVKLFQSDARTVVEQVCAAVRPVGGAGEGAAVERPAAVEEGKPAEP